MTLTRPNDTTMYVQAAIIGRLVDDLLAAGLRVSVLDNDGDRATHCENVADKTAIMESIFNPELDAGDYTLDVSKPDATEPFGWVRLIDGNGVDVISDYSTVLDDVVKGANGLAAHIDEGWSAEGWAVFRLRNIEAAARNLLIWSDTLHPEHDAMVEVEAERAMEEGGTSQAVTERLRAELVKALEVEVRP